MKPIKILVVEDSPVVQKLLVHMFTDDPDMEVVGTASDGVEAIELLKTIQPDVVTMDVNMPRMNGLEVCRHIMETRPLPIVIVSANWESKEVAGAFQAIEAGALAVVGKPKGPGHPQHAEDVRKLVQTVKTMAGVKVVRRWVRPHLQRTAALDLSKAGLPVDPAADSASDVMAVAIGASTGGPPVLQTILSRLPRSFPVPIFIVQHITAGFLHGLADWLGATTRFPVRVAVHNEVALPGHAYLAPDGSHMAVERANGDLDVGGSLRIVLSRDDPVSGLRPSVAHLFASMARALGKNGVGVLLTGMGRDGATELKLMRDCGATTVAQDQDSSIVHGMPGEAIKMDAAMHVLPPEQIAALLISVAAPGRLRRA